MSENYTDGLDLMALVSKILKKWKLVFIVTFIFSVLGVLMALKAQKQYRTTMTLAPEVVARNRSFALSSMMNINYLMAQTNTDALNITLFPEISTSTPFLASLFNVPVTPYVSLEDQLKGVPVDTTTVFLHILGRDRTLSEKEARKRAEADAEYVYDDSVIDPGNLTPRQMVVANALKGAISTDVNQKTGVTTISVTMDDRMIVKQLADTVCQRLQDFVTEYRTSKARRDYEQYEKLAEEAHKELVKAQAAYAASVDYDRSVILQSVNSERQRLQNEANLANQIYSQLAQQRESAKAKVQDDKPVYAVVQPPTVPNSSVTSRAKICITWFFVGFMLACAWAVFGDDLLKTLKGMMKKEDGPSEA